MKLKDAMQSAAASLGTAEAHTLYTKGLIAYGLLKEVLNTHPPASEGEMTEKQFKDVVSKLNAIVAHAGHNSTLRGLEVVAAALAALLDVYVAPNPENPEGMCDDPEAFRRHFCQIVLEAPATVQNKMRPE